MLRSHRVALTPRTVAFYPEAGCLRAASVQDHGLRMPKDARFEVIHQTPDRRDVAWRFFATREAADAFVQEVR